MRISTIYLLILLVSICLLFTKCSKPLDSISNQTWEGGIIRTEDEKMLSKAKMLIKVDTFFIFSNAVFGAENDTLLVERLEEKQMIVNLKNMDKSMNWRVAIQTSKEKPNQLILNGGDFYINFEKATNDIFQDDQLSFYLNQPVSNLTFMYLFGVYTGE
ncbi:MAG: hypothetical protein ACKVOU_13885, partial [Cytophagales bacterium]